MADGSVSTEDVALSNDATSQLVKDSSNPSDASEDSNANSLCFENGGASCICAVGSVKIMGDLTKTVQDEETLVCDGNIDDSEEFVDCEKSYPNTLGSSCSLLTPRDNVSTPASQSSQNDDLQMARMGTESSLSGDDASLSWLKEPSMASSSSLGSRQEEEFYSARESPMSNVSTDSSRSASSNHNAPVRPVELMNSLEEGPRITLPPTELPVILSSENKLHSPTEDTTPQQSPENTQAVSVADLPSRESVEKLPYMDSVEEDVVNVRKEEAEVRPMSASKVEEPKAEASPPRPMSSPPERSTAPAKPKAKRTPNDFIFGKVIGEGSYSTVYLAKEVSTQTEFAIKVCDKKHLIRERKTHFVMREKEVLMKLDHPFFIKLAYTFQDPERLYYVLTYARNGELLGYLHKLSAFDLPCTRFYTAEIVLALEYLHSLGIIHRDLKPENILLSEDMHIKITDFGTSKILSSDTSAPTETKRKNSFVGTAEYVSPEVLNNQPANVGSDLWGLGCIIYQCLSGSLPFRSGNEYQTFQKIVKVEYDFPEGFNESARDLVQKLLVLEPMDRLGMKEPERMGGLKQHPFYGEIDWDTLPQASPPKLMPYLPASGNNPEFWGQEQRTGFDDQRLAEIITGQSADGTQSPELEEVTILRPSSAVREEKRQEKLRKQRLENQFHPFVEGNLILRQGFVDKRKGLFARKRMLLLTEGPHLYYVDAHNKVLKGEIPWSQHLRPEAKNFKIFFVHTPHRTYYLESRFPDAHLWVKKIEEVWKRYFGDKAQG